MNQKMSTQEFEIIYERYKTTLYRVAFTYLKNNHDVLDVLQEVFMKRFNKAPHFENEDQEKYWMIRITINLSKNHLNSFWHKNVGTIDEISESQDVMQFDFSESESDMFKRVMLLPDKQKTVMLLYYYEEYNCREISEILKCRESTVKMRLERGRELLKIQIEEEEL